MKKINKIKIIVLFICMLFVTSTVYAGTAYVDSIVVDAKINIDGSMTVKETIVWDIIEDLNGVYRDILIENPSNELNSASRIEISEVVVEDKVFTYSPTTLQNGESGKYNINTIEGGKQIKIFTPSSDEYKTTSITYTLYDVVVKYNDIAELYWNFIGSGWNYGIDDIVINITLPGDARTLKVFAHGPLYGYSSIPSTDSVVLEVGNLRSGEMVDARVLFDASLVMPTKVVNKNVLESILTKEAKLAQEANLKREHAKKIFNVSIILGIIAAILPIVIYIFAYRKVEKPNFKGKYYRELPEDYGPALMNKVLHPVTGMATSYDMLATLLDLVRRKYVEIEPIEKTGKKKSKDYLLKLVNTDISELNESEKHFVSNLIFVDTNEIALKDLSRKNSKTFKAQHKAHKEYTKWTQIIEKLAKEKDLIKTGKTKTGKYLLMFAICVALSVGIAAYGVINNYDDIYSVGIISTVFSFTQLVAMEIKLYELNIRTKKGKEHNAMWKAFKKFLLDFSKLDEHDYKSIAIWDHYLVYATALGISEEVIKELKIVFPTEFEQGSDMFSTYVTISLLSDNDAFSSFSDSFTSAASTAFSASSSADGSVGGFAGGAGGGRWRRWWRWILDTPMPI